MDTQKIAKILYNLSLDMDYADSLEYKDEEVKCITEELEILKQNECFSTLQMLEMIALKNEDMERVMEENRIALNAMLPAYSQISKMKIYPEEFEKTPKKSIKRFLYQEAKG